MAKMNDDTLNQRNNAMSENNQMLRERIVAMTAEINDQEGEF
jgi:hypothetical protein